MQEIDSHASPKMHTTDLTLPVSLPKGSFEDLGSHEVQDGEHNHNEVRQVGARRETATPSTAIHIYQRQPGPGTKLVSLSRPGAAKAV